MTGRNQRRLRMEAAAAFGNKKMTLASHASLASLFKAHEIRCFFCLLPRLRAFPPLLVGSLGNLSVISFPDLVAFSVPASIVGVAFMLGCCISSSKDVGDCDPKLLPDGVSFAEKGMSPGESGFLLLELDSNSGGAAKVILLACCARLRSNLSFPAYASISIRHQQLGDLCTNACFMNLPAAALSRLIGARLSPLCSIFLIFSKYCLTLVNSRKIGCSLALTPFNRK